MAFGRGFSAIRQDIHFEKRVPVIPPVGVKMRVDFVACECYRSIG